LSDPWNKQKAARARRREAEAGHGGGEDIIRSVRRLVWSYYLRLEEASFPLRSTSIQLAVPLRKRMPKRKAARRDADAGSDAEDDDSVNVKLN